MLSVNSSAFARAINVSAAVTYALLFIWAYEHYISVRWHYFLLTFRGLELSSYVMIVLQTAVVAAFMPDKVARPSALILWFLFAFVHVPSLVVSYSVASAPSDYEPVLLAMTTVLAVAGLMSSRAPAAATPRIEPSSFVRRAFEVVWVLVSLSLIAKYYPIMSLAGLNDVYEQRALALENTGGMFSYVRAYYSGVLTPALLAYGLFYRRPLDTILGLIGSILAYMIAAQKMVLIIPALMILFRFSHQLGRYHTAYYTSSLAALTGLCALLVNHNPAVRAFADIVLMRAMALPGAFVSQYQDYFRLTGYTWWSHARGISLIVPAPAAHATDPQWPELGRIVGGAYYGFSRGMNSNANLFVADGIAAAGWFGVLVIGAVMIAWLRVMDAACREWNSGFVVLVLIPVAMALTNGQLTTVLLSFGGAFWTLAFLFYRPRRVG